MAYKSISYFIHDSRLILTWESLARTGSSKLVSLTVLVPVFGYLIIFNQQVVSLFDLSPYYIPSIEENWAWLIDGKDRLYYFYFGLFFVGLGSIFYQIFCPAIVKEFKTGFEYMTRGKDLYTSNNIVLLYKVISRSKVSHARHIADRISDESRGRRIIDDDTNEPKLPENFLYHRRVDLIGGFWSHLIFSKPIWRILTQFSYIAGFVILAIPSLDMFIRVLMAVFRPEI